MSPALMQLLLGLLAEAPQLFTDAENVVHSIANGEGGANKIGNILANVSTLTAHAATALPVVAGASVASTPPAPAETSPPGPTGMPVL